MTEACPADGTIAELAQGELAESERAQIERHVAGCGSCAAVVAELARLIAPGNDDAGLSPSSSSVGRYELFEPLGAGGMGLVVEGWDPVLSRRVAIKLVRPDRRDAPRVGRERVLAEARALASIADPHVLAIHDVVESDRGICLVTELVDGDPASLWVERARPHWRDIVDACVQAGRGLAAVHARGMFHGDVKPANLFVGRDGRVRLGDFGLASVDGRSRGGTPGFMAPEHGDRAIDARADQFALGMTAIAMLGGKPVPPNTAPDALPLPAEAPVDLRGALARAIRERPADRFASTRDFVDALEAARAPPRRRRWPLAAIAGAGIAAIAIIWLVPPASEAPPPEPKVAPGAEPARSRETTESSGRTDASRIAQNGSAASLVATSRATTSGASTEDPATSRATASRAATASPATSRATPSGGSTSSPATSRATPASKTVTAQPGPARPATRTGSARDALQEALRDGDGPACAAAVERLRVEEPAFPTLDADAAYCQLMLGHCLAALPTLRAAVGDAAQALAYEYCPPDGDMPEQRVRRAQLQKRFHRDEAGCRRRMTWISYATSADDEILFAGNAMECWGALGRCDDARAVAADLTARLVKRSTTSDRADVARWVPQCAKH